MLLTSAGKMGNLRGIRRAQYFKALIKWRAQLRENNKATQKLCVAILGGVKDILIRNEPPRGLRRMTAAPAKAS